MSRWAFLALVVAVVHGCQSSPSTSRARPADPPRPTVEVHFVAPGHLLADCAPGLSADLLAHPDGLLFFERDSTIRVTTPPGREPYHVHLVERSDGRRLEREIAGDPSGATTVDLAGIAAPEALVVTSASHRVNPAKGADVAVLPAYALSFRLVPFEQAPAILAAQDGRYDLETPVGTIRLLVSPLNQGDMLLSLVDEEQKLERIYSDAYIHFKPADAYVAPKLTVEVAKRGGAVWQRVGAWPTAAEPAGTEPAYALRTPRRELLAFAPPPRLDVMLPEAPPATAARVGATPVGVRTYEERFHLTVAHAVPQDRQGRRYDYRVQACEIAGGSTATATLDLSSLDAGRFPLTASVVHRFVPVWRAPGGFFEPREPLGRATVEALAAGDPPKLHKNVVAAAHASHYHLLRFTGVGAKPGRAPSAEPVSLAGAPLSPIVLPRPPSHGMPGGGVTTLPGAPGGMMPAGFKTGKGGGGGGGVTPGIAGNQNCPCGAGGASCPRPKNKCNGNCGLNCRCSDDSKPGDLKITFECGCGVSEKDCRCDKHFWSSRDIEAAMVKAFPGAADLAWYGAHGDAVPCHTETVVGIARVTYWDGARLVEHYYRVSVTYAPCVPKPRSCVCGPNGANCPAVQRCDGLCPNCQCKLIEHPPPKELQPPGRPKGDDRPSVPSVDPRFEDTIEIEADEDGNEVETESPYHLPVNSPSLTIQVQRFAAIRTLGIQAADGRFTVPASLLFFDPAQVSIDRAAISEAYWKRVDAVLRGETGPDGQPLSWEWPVLHPGSPGGSTPGEPGPRPPEPAPLPEPSPSHESSFEPSDPGFVVSPSPEPSGGELLPPRE